MKKIIIYTLCVVLVLGCSVTAFAVDPFGQYMYRLDKSNFTNGFDFHFTLSLEDQATFNLWSISPVESYLGVFQGVADAVPGTEFYLQNKPFGNTDLSQTTTKGDVIRNGWYMPIDAIPLNEVVIRTQIDIRSENTSYTAILPEDGASGEFCIAFLDKNGVVIGLYKKVIDYTCTVTYGDLRYVGRATFRNMSIPNGTVGYTIYSTAYDLYAEWATGTNNSEIQIYNSNVMNFYYNDDDLPSGSIEDSLDEIINGDAKPSVPSGGDSVGNLEEVEGDLKDSANNGLESGTNLLEQFSGTLLNYYSSFRALTLIFDCFINVPLIGIIVLASAAIGILPMILNIGLDVGRWSANKNSTGRSKSSKK